MYSTEFFVARFHELDTDARHTLTQVLRA